MQAIAPGGPKNITFLRLTPAGRALVCPKFPSGGEPGFPSAGEPEFPSKKEPNIQEVSSNKLPQDSCGLSPAGPKAGDSYKEMSEVKTKDIMAMAHKPEKLTLADVSVQTLAEIQGPTWFYE